jgi:NAD-dependent dihydropyrimidine dehydrogenase PreA subunit
LLCSDPANHDGIEPGDVTRSEGLHDAKAAPGPIAVVNTNEVIASSAAWALRSAVRIVLAGRLINDFRESPQARAGSLARVTPPRCAITQLLVTSCAEVCPVDCIHPTTDDPDWGDHEQLYIDPAECIDCDACVEACPVDAITPEDQVPSEWKRFIGINAAYYRRGSGGLAA